MTHSIDDDPDSWPAESQHRSTRMWGCVFLAAIVAVALATVAIVKGCQ